MSLFWGPSSLAPIAFTGLVNDAGLMFFPPPPAGEQIFTYHVYPDAGQASFYWLAAVLVAPPGQTNYNSITTASDTELLTERPRLRVGERAARNARHGRRRL